jgi:hypothetical protein
MAFMPWAACAAYSAARRLRLSLRFLRSGEILAGDQELSRELDRSSGSSGVDIRAGRKIRKESP